MQQTEEYQLNELENTYQYFLKDQDAYDRLYDNEYRMKQIKKQLAKPSKGPDVTLTGLIALGIGLFLYNSVDHMVGIIAGVVSFFGGLIGFVAFGKQHKKSIRNELALKTHESNVLSKQIVNDYAMYASTYGRPCIMASPRYCNPKDLKAIIDLMKKGNYGIDGASVYLFNSLHICESLPEKVVVQQPRQQAQRSSFHHSRQDAPDQESQAWWDKMKEENDRKWKEYHNQSGWSNQSSYGGGSQSSSAAGDTDDYMFFKGVTDYESLHKRYLALMKAYHTDEGNGDDDTAKEINREYNELKKKFGK